ncbi:Hypp1290 [Branchiostoma lanceolatum]|uniref:Hypp1290 protein n=1 Tax=Branchiostoma lanceolatum TaxID=7740 RepID=A0A8K0EJT4_BRALA|nr:Hypp1290 [Branchiostoma lanceolatum]
MGPLTKVDCTFFKTPGVNVARQLLQRQMHILRSVSSDVKGREERLQCMQDKVETLEIRRMLQDSRMVRTTFKNTPTDSPPLDVPLSVINDSCIITDTSKDSTEAS